MKRGESIQFRRNPLELHSSVSSIRQLLNRTPLPTKRIPSALKTRSLNPPKKEILTFKLPSVSKIETEENKSWRESRREVVGSEYEPLNEMIIGSIPPVNTTITTTKHKVINPRPRFGSIMDNPQHKGRSRNASKSNLKYNLSMSKKSYDHSYSGLIVPFVESESERLKRLSNRIHRIQGDGMRMHKDNLQHWNRRKGQSMFSIKLKEILDQIIVTPPSQREYIDRWNSFQIDKNKLPPANQKHYEYGADRESFDINSCKRVILSFDWKEKPRTFDIEKTSATLMHKNIHNKRNYARNITSAMKYT